MTLHNKFNITLPLLLGLMVSPVLSGCSDEELLPDIALNNPDAVTFSASAVASAENNLTRGANREYQPLTLSSEGKEDISLYLHTYDSPRIGFRAGESSDDENSAETPTRGAQILNADNLRKFHKSFKVKATRNLDGSPYIGWTDSRVKDDDNNIWLTNRTEYWPSRDMLDFFAVSPASEFDNLKDLREDEGRISFSYSARKGAPSADKDAESQPDLLLAGVSCNKEGSDNGRAPLKFHHALSAVKFAVRDVLGGEVVKIEISGVNSEGDCVYAFDPSTGEGGFEWSGQKNPGSFSQIFNHDIPDRYVATDDDSQDIILNTAMPEKTFMMIPQHLTEDARIRITLKRAGLSTITVGGKIIDNDVREWKPGHEYIYTVSTSKDNWVYVFNATGNHKSSTGAHNVNGDQIYVYSPAHKNYDTYGNDAYFRVVSYRYRANNQELTEILPWTASHEAPVQTNGDNQVVNDRILSAEQWIPSRSALKGAGSAAASGQKKNITMLDHYTTTNWSGDGWMQQQQPYTSSNSATDPWDLSKPGGAVRNTANSYVIDREGWYAFPLVYGNAVTGGKDVKSAYDNTAFVDHNGIRITSAYIPEPYCRSAEIVWSDVFNAVTDVSLETVEKNGKKEKMIIFKAQKWNLQQGNVIIALYDNEDPSNGNIVWSWHIWITEHWLDPSSGLCDALDGSDATVAFSASKSGWRERGDLLLDNNYVTASQGYYIAPYNLGWCDEKMVDYLKREGTMTYVQNMPDGTPTGLTKTLPIIQAGTRIDYKYGNNTYYQWGRKDAMVGFVNHLNEVKRNFGKKQYSLKKQTVDFATSIREPHVLYCKAPYVSTTKYDNWASSNYSYLWNNGGTETKPKKTVYDPCPPGYMVPPTAALAFIGPDNNGSFTNSSTDNQPPLKNYQGKILDSDDPYTFIVSSVKNLTRRKDTSIWLVGTGNRWYCDGHPTLKDPLGNSINGGDNFNPTVVYLASCQQATGTLGYGIAFGIDSQYIKDPSKPSEVDRSESKYVITNKFNGRKSMARPVRPFRE